MIKLLSSSVLLAVAFTMTGCSTLPAPDKMRSEVAGFELPKQPEPGKALVYVVRPSGLGGLVRFNVFVDDQEAPSEMGYTRAAQYIYFNLKPGAHKIYSKAENWAEVQVTAAAGDIIYIHQEPEIGMIMSRNSITKIEELTGKYHVKKTTPGTILKAER